MPRCPVAALASATAAVAEEGTKAVVAMRREGRGGWVVWVEGWRVDGGRRWAQAKVGRVVVRVVVRVEYGEGGHIDTHLTRQRGRQ